MAVVAKAIGAAMRRRARARGPARPTAEERREAESALREHHNWTLDQQANIAYWNSNRGAPYQIRTSKSKWAASWTRIRDYLEQRRER